MTATNEETLILCPRCRAHPKPARGELCTNCRAAEIADAAGELPFGSAAPVGATRGTDDGKVTHIGQQTQAPAAQRDVKPANPAPKQETKPAPAPAQQQRSAAPAPRASGISSGRKDAPMRIVIYGVPGVGKTRFIVDAPNPIIIPAEQGAEGFDVARFDDPHPPRSFGEVMDHVLWLQNEPHDYQTVGLDTADMIEQLAYQEAIRKYNRSSGSKRDGAADNIEEVGGGYKKGYTAAAAEWMRLLAELERLRIKRRMNVIITAHQKVTRFSNPAGEDYDRHTLKLHQDAGLGLVQEWAEAVLFATFKTTVQRQGKRGKAKGVGGKERVLYTQHDAAYEAKNRFDLPAMLPLDWGAFHDAVQANKSVELLRSAIDAALVRLGTETIEVNRKQIQIADWVAGQLQKNPDSRRLAQLKNRLEARVEALEDEHADREEASRAAGDVT